MNNGSLWSSLFAANVGRIISSMGGAPRTDAGWDAVTQQAWDEADLAAEALERESEARRELAQIAADTYESSPIGPRTSGTRSIAEIGPEVMASLARRRDRHLPPADDGEELDTWLVQAGAPAVTDSHWGPIVATFVEYWRRRGVPHADWAPVWRRWVARLNQRVSA